LYEHLQFIRTYPKIMVNSDFYLVFLVDAKHLDYSGSQPFLQTFTKHPDTHSKECNVGHAWIFLKGRDKNGKIITVEGGHSGETGLEKPRYFDGISDLIESHDPNPAKYLQECLEDGFFQQGSGNHIPTFAAKIDLTEQQFQDILTFIDPKNYPYKKYSLTQRQCASFITQIAALIDIELESEITLPIKREMFLGNQKIQLWTDEKYAEITFASPDILEKSLMKLTQHGQLEYALPFFITKKRNRAIKKTRESACHTMQRFPERYLRHKSV